ncbi:MAG: sodium transport system permease protein [Planctomycetota bacterium]|jgi:sodium transport system permease protein
MSQPTPGQQPIQPKKQLWAVLSCELRQLLRDKRALFATIVLPMLLYPWLLYGQNKISDISENQMKERTLQVLHDLSRLPADQAAPILDAIAAIQGLEGSTFDGQAFADLETRAALAPEGDSSDEAVDFTTQRRLLYGEILPEDSEILVVGYPSHNFAGRPEVAIYFDVKVSNSREAQNRVTSALGELKQQQTKDLRIKLLGSDPGAFLSLELVDVASEQERGGAKLARMLPMLLVLLLISGGAFAALSVFAGEREGGTLETLLVQPMSPQTLAYGKYASVAVAALFTLLANLAALYLCVALGLTSGNNSEMGDIGPMRLLAAMLYAPGALLLCAMLCLALGRARTFREGQYLLLPLMLVAAIPSAIVFQPGLPHNVYLAAIPFAGAALTLRDVLRGDLTLAPTLVMIVSHLFWSWLALRQLANQMDGEGALVANSDVQKAARQGPARHGMRWGFAGVLAVYIIGSWLQSKYMLSGLAWTLWGLMPAMAIVCAMRAKNRSGSESNRSLQTGAPYVSVIRELGLRMPNLGLVIGGLLLVPAMGWTMEHFLSLQMKALPLPSRMASSGAALEALFNGLSTSKLLFLFAVSPGFCEELFFRGAVLSSLRRGFSARKALLWQTLFFAAAHAQIHRLMPTAIMGLLFGALTLRARSIWPAVFCHAAYDGYIIMQATGRLPYMETAWFPYLPWLALPGIILIVLIKPKQEA